MYSGSLVIEESIQQAVDRFEPQNIQQEKIYPLMHFLQIDAEQIKNSFVRYRY